MQYVVPMIAYALDFYCDALLIALLLRMILSLFDPTGEGLILRFIAFFTAPLLILSDKILVLLRIDNSGPFDISVFIGYALLMIVRALLVPFLG